MVTKDRRKDKILQIQNSHDMYRGANAMDVANKIKNDIKAATIRKSVVVVLTGDGKGKTTSAVGMLVRALGAHKKCALFQFFKGGMQSGEIKVLAQLGVEVVKADNVCWWNETKSHELMKKITPVLEKLRQALLCDGYDLIVIDEGTYLLSSKLWGTDELLDLIKHRTKNTSVVITGRDADPLLCEMADTVTEMKMHKHAFEANIAAQCGIEW